MYPIVKRKNTIGTKRADFTSPTNLAEHFIIAMANLILLKKQTTNKTIIAAKLKNITELHLYSSISLFYPSA